MMKLESQVSRQSLKRSWTQVKWASDILPPYLPTHLTPPTDGLPLS